MSGVLLLGVGLALAAGGVHMLPLVGTGLLVVVALLSLRGPGERTSSAEGADLVPRRRSRLLIGLLLVNFAYWVSSALLSGLPLSSVFSYGFLRWHLRSIPGYLPLLAIAVSGYRFSDRDKKVAVCALLIPATLISLVGAAQYATGFRIAGYSEGVLPSTVRYDLGEYWFFGFLRAHVTCGGYYSTVALVALGLFWFWRTDWWRRGLVFLALGVSAWGLMFSKARTFVGAFAGAACLMFVYGCWVRLRLRGTRSAPSADEVRCKGTDRYLPLRPQWVAMALGAVVAAYCLTPRLHARMRATFVEPGADLPSQVAAATKHDRRIFWEAALRLAKRHPVFGAGLGRFGDEYDSYAHELELPWQPAGTQHHAHNSWLHVAAELGLVGVGLLLALWVVSCAWLWGAVRAQEAGSFGAALSVGVLAAVAAQLAAALFDHNLWSAQLMIPLTTLIGVAAFVPASVATPAGRSPLQSADARDQASVRTK